MCRVATTVTAGCIATNNGRAKLSLACLRPVLRAVWSMGSQVGVTCTGHTFIRHGIHHTTWVGIIASNGADIDTSNVTIGDSVIDLGNSVVVAIIVTVNVVVVK